MDSFVIERIVKGENEDVVLVKDRLKFIMKSKGYYIYMDTGINTIYAKK